jgi:hypothetical protein
MHNQNTESAIGGEGVLLTYRFTTLQTVTTIFLKLLFYLVFIALLSFQACPYRVAPFHPLSCPNVGTNVGRTGVTWSRNG